MKNIPLFLAAALALLTAMPSVLRAEDDIHVLYQEGRAAFFAGQWEIAREKLSLVLAKNPTHPETRAMMATIVQKIGADNTVLRKSYEKVMIEKFEVNDVTLDEALQALRILSKNASAGKIVPNVIVKDPELGKKNVTLNLSKVPLSECINYLAQLTGGKLTYDKSAAIIASPAAPAPAG